MALVLLAHDWGKKHNINIHSFTVDHQLRSNSYEEAKTVNKWLETRGFSLPFFCFFQTKHLFFQTKLRNQTFYLTTSMGQK